MKKVCMNCGATQGPFDVLFVGERKLGWNIYTCPIPTGKTVTPEQQKAAAVACNNRRAKKEASDAQQPSGIPSPGSGVLETTGQIVGIPSPE